MVPGKGMRGGENSNSFRLHEVHPGEACWLEAPAWAELVHVLG